MEKQMRKELLSYIFWGITTTGLSIAVYTVLGYVMDYRAANMVSIVFAKVYAYFVNKTFVFKHSCSSLKELLYEMTAYVLSRGFTGLVDFFGVIILVELCSAEQDLAKYTVTAIVMVLNYIFGKKVVFAGRKKDRNGI